MVLRLGQAVCRDETGITQRNLQIIRNEIQIIIFLINFFIQISEIVDDVNDNNINMDDENVLSYIECTMKKFSGVSITSIII